MNALRGAIVVIVGLVIAVVILARGLDGPETTNEPLETTDTTAASAQPADAPPPPPDPAPAPQPAPAEPAPAPPAELPEPAPEDMFAEPPPPPDPTHDPAEVRVLVANGTDVCGAAGRLTTSLSVRGFNVLPATNADSAANASAIYYLEGYGADAGVVASLLTGVDSSQVLPMPASPPTAPGDAHVVVHIGADDLAQPNC